MNAKNIVVSAGVALLVVALGLAFFGQPSEKVIEKIVEKVTFGAFPGPDISSDYLCVNGSCTYYRNGNCLDATTTLFSILNPAAATSTFYVDVFSGNSGTSSLAVVFGTSTASTLGNTDFPQSVWATTTISTSTGFFRQGPGQGYNGAGISDAPQILRATSSPATLIGPSEYVFAKATGTNIITGTNGGSDGLINANNTFTCEYRVRFVR